MLFIHFELPFYKIRFGIIEPLIYFVYISILIILPKSFLRKEVLIKIAKSLIVHFFFSIIFGFLDFIIYDFGFNLLGRAIFDPITIGQRFHSFAGEPRDYVLACIYYLSSLSIFFVSPLLGNTFRKYFKFYLLILIPLAILSLILTKSFTFIASASIFLIVIFTIQIIKLINTLVKIKLKKSNFLGILLGFTFSLILFFVLSNSNFLQIIGLDRIAHYLESFDKLQIYLRDGTLILQLILQNLMIISKPIICCLSSTRVFYS